MAPVLSMVPVPAIRVTWARHAISVRSQTNSIIPCVYTVWAQQHAVVMVRAPQAPARAYALLLTRVVLATSAPGRTCTITRHALTVWHRLHAMATVPARRMEPACVRLDLAAPIATSVPLRKDTTGLTRNAPTVKRPRHAVAMALATRWPERVRATTPPTLDSDATSARRTVTITQRVPCACPVQRAADMVPVHRRPAPVCATRDSPAPRAISVR